MTVILSLHGSAMAFGPDAAASVASRISTVLPMTAGWDPSWNVALAAAVEASAVAEEDAADPEAVARTHRWDAARASADATPGPADAVGGLAPFALAESYVRLEMAFSSRDAAGAIDAAATLATHASDLADPFLVTAPDPAEVDGARALWSDATTPATLAPPATADETVIDPVAAAMALARESAALRPAIEDAVARGEGAAVDRMRDERLSAALALAGRLTLQAWRRAGSPDLGTATPNPGEAWVRPNPARAGATLLFDAVSAGSARLELFDVSGRRVGERSITLTAPGPQRVPLDGPGSGSRPAGVYLARVTQGDRVATARFIQAR